MGWESFRKTKLSSKCNNQSLNKCYFHHYHSEVNVFSLHKFSEKRTAEKKIKRNRKMIAKINFYIIDKALFKLQWWPQLHFMGKPDAPPKTTRKISSLEPIWSSLLLQVCVRAICQVNEKGQHKAVQPVKTYIDIFSVFSTHLIFSW